jgi:hypothetical protein
VKRYAMVISGGSGKPPIFTTAATQPFGPRFQPKLGLSKWGEHGKSNPEGTSTMTPQMKSDSLMVITGAGGFIGGRPVKYFFDKNFKRIRAVDKKPLDQWWSGFEAF